MTEQERLIGKHPVIPHILGHWTSHEDLPTIPNKKHRKLDEVVHLRQSAIEKIADWIIEHHIIDNKIELLKRKAQLLEKYDFDQFVKSSNLLPNADKTQKGNVAEIILVEYLKESTTFSPMIHKLRYNPNVEQSMKGDDVLLLNPNDLQEKVIYGESKYRSNPSKQTIDEIISNLEGSKKLPLSIGFVANILYDREEDDLADQLMDLQALLNNGAITVHNVGFLMSTKSTTPSKDTASQVENHLNTSNPNLVFLSLGLDNPLEIVQESFKLAADKLLKIY
jgi:Cap4 SAVED domain